jgi:hypothetical protein
MTEKPQQPGRELAREFTEAWAAWMKASTGVAGSAQTQDPFAQLTAAFGGYAGAVAAPLRELAGQQRELAESMARWALLQRDLAEQVETWAEHGRALADTLDAMLAPFVAFMPAPARRHVLTDQEHISQL